MVSTTGRFIRRFDDVELASYDVIPRLLAQEVKIVRVPILPPRADAMTIKNLILIKRDDRREGDRTLFVHELVHVQQYDEHGYFGFTARYLWDYLIGLVKYRSHRKAYLAIPMEVEAREIAEEWRRAKAGLERIIDLTTDTVDRAGDITGRALD